MTTRSKEPVLVVLQLSGGQRLPEHRDPLHRVAIQGLSPHRGHTRGRRTTHR